MRIVCIILALLVAGCPLASAADTPAGEDMSTLFPDLEGWTKDGSPEIFYADNLWEYIDGAAEIYLTYDFQRVATLTYESGPEKSLTIDIYEHDTPRNAFGIYSQEKPTEGDFLQIGTQGYYDRGILNFYFGSYYVKIMGFDLGEGEKQFLESTGREVAGGLNAQAVVPKPLQCFPAEGKIAHSERYIAKDFLGRRALHSAFTAEYEIKGETRRIFIIEADNEEDARSMLKKYLDQVGEKGMEIRRENGIYRFIDPYFESSGMMNIKSAGRYIWGLFGGDDTPYAFYIDQIETNLEKNRLLD